MKKIVSLLPSSTEICYVLELDQEMVGVSHECDYPNAAQAHPKLTKPKVDPTAKSEDIHEAVSSLVGSGLSVYHVDEDKLKELSPDLIVTQDTCEVCAVSLKEVEEATCRLLNSETQIVSLSPLSLSDVLGDVLKVGKAVGKESLANAKVSELKDRLEQLKERTKALSKPKVLMVEWITPPMIAGHWTPELVEAAGGVPVLGHANQPTGPVSLAEIEKSEADVIIVAPCGFKIEQSKKEMEAFLNLAEIQSLPAFKNEQVYIIDGNAYFNRPGPRLIESAEILASAIHPELQKYYSFPETDVIKYSI